MEPTLQGAGLPLVSVVLCVHNERKYLDDAVRSVLQQTYPAVELILVDNGSTDGSIEKLREYGQAARTRLLAFPTNEQITKRLNQGIAEANGTFVSILYGDDFYLPEKIAKQVATFQTLAP